MINIYTRTNIVKILSERTKELKDLNHFHISTNIIKYLQSYRYIVLKEKHHINYYCITEEEFDKIISLAILQN